MRKYSLLLICFALSVVSFAQKAVITFETKTWDFGKIAEEDKKATYVFNFTNTGKSPLVVSRVHASCGCTTPTWTKEPIEPGKKGSVTVAYNPLGRPGAREKRIGDCSLQSVGQAGCVYKNNYCFYKCFGRECYPAYQG